MDDFRYLRSRDPNKNTVTASISKKFGKHDSSPRSGTVWMWAILGRLRRCAVNVCRACAVYLCSVWDFVRDLSVTQDVVSVTHVIVSVTLDEAAVTVINCWSSTRVDHCQCGGVYCACCRRLLCVICYNSGVKKTTMCNSCRTSSVSSNLSLKRTQET